MLQKSVSDYWKGAEYIRVLRLVLRTSLQSLSRRQLCAKSSNFYPFYRFLSFEQIHVLKDRNVTELGWNHAFEDDFDASGGKIGLPTEIWRVQQSD